MSRRALVIDDDADLAAVIGEYLHLLGFQSDICTDATEGSARALSGGYEVVLCDKNMPRQDGFEIAEAVRAGAPTTRFVLCTGEVAGPELLRAAECVGVDVLEKPRLFDSLGLLLQ